MPNRIIDYKDPGGVIAKESLMQLKNNLVLGNMVHREYKEEFKKIGDTVNIRRPVKFITSNGATRVNQDAEEGTANIVMNQRKHVSWNFSTQDLTLRIEDYSERYIRPAMITLANTMDKFLFGLYTKVWNSVGTPGTTPGTFAAVAAASQRQDEMAVMSEDRMACLSPAAAWAIAANQTTLQQQEMVKGAYRRAAIGDVAGYATYRSQNVPNHTTGARGGTPLVNGAAQNVAYSAADDSYSQSLIVDGASNSITGWAKAGDVFTLAGVFAVNPVPGEGSTGKTVMPYLQEFTVLADANSSGAGAVTLTISPAIIVSGPYQTVSAAPADNAALTFRGSAATAYPQNLCLHKNAIALVSVPLEMPDGVSFKGRQSADGLSVRIVKDYDIDNDVDIIRVDALYGGEVIYPDLACRLWG